ncbi:MAG: hypothetical protein ACAI44_37790 [Candidatus Sericytochromatia bacterium]
MNTLDFVAWLPVYLAALWLLRAALWRGAERLAASDRLSAAGLGYGLILLIWPFSAPGWTGLGNVLGDLKAWQRAQTCFDLARRLRPDWIEAWLGLGVVALVLDQDYERAHACFLQAYLLRRGTPVNLVDTLPVIRPGIEAEDPIADKLLHDADQLGQLVNSGRLSADLLERADSYRQLAQGEGHGLPQAYQRALWLDQPAWSGSPLLPVDAARVEADYAASDSILTWYDGLLRREVLDQLLEFCQYSTIWHHIYANGYLGAYIDDGMTCPLLYQIAQALKDRFPTIFADTRLVYLWAFKCRAHAPGVALHHDSALVNVNFWLTPDSANRDPGSGGICVYPKAPPANWDLERYQIAPADMAHFVEGVDPICVPYRQNRVVIFNSRLFHATQPFDFAPGYLNQRLNVTLLFGRQPLRYHEKKKLTVNS